MKLSILVPSRNMASKIDQFFEYAYGGSADESKFEIVIVDSSTDNSMDIFKKYQEKHKNLQVIHRDRQVYCGTARNIAYQSSKGEYIYCMDIDDRFHSKDSLDNVLKTLENDDNPKDIYYCPFSTAKSDRVKMMPRNDIGTLAYAAVGCWNKMYRREFYVYFPDYMPEDVAAHYVLVDKCKTVGSFGFPVYRYDNMNPGAISRTFDYFQKIPHNLIHLAMTPEIEDMGIRQEYLVGVMKNMADMFSLRNQLKNPDVRAAWINKFRQEFGAFSSGFYTH